MAGGDTIFALASGRPPSGLAVFRVSGPHAGAALRALAGGALPPPRFAARVRLAAPGGGALDDGLALWFPAPASFTGEDVAELHVHGGRAVVEAVAAALAAQPGLRPAEAGEFTRRAYENGKLDLTQAEALADLVAAETEAQRAQALDQLGGALGARFEAWRGRLLDLLAHVEAALDFADEEIPEDLLAPVVPKILGIREEMTQYIDDQNRGERLREGFRVVLLGAPNTGKSSLLNALARREAAIVSETEGTTRDVIEVHLDLSGLPVILADTAGLRAAPGEIEAEGVRRAEARAAAADLRLLVFDASRWPARDAATAARIGPGAICVLNKADLVNPLDFSGDFQGLEIVSETKERIPACLVSARTGAGLAELLAEITAALAAAQGQDRAGGAPLTRARHRRALEDAVAALSRAVPDPAALPAPELLGEELRLAARAVGRVTGGVDVEEVLDRIFAEFCIGK